MKTTAIATDKAPKAIGPYSQGIRAGGFIFFSGQVPLDPVTGEIVGTEIEAQAERVLLNVRELVHFSGRQMSDVVKTTIFLTDLSHFAKVNEMYAKFFREPYPARSTVEVKALPKKSLIEIECIVKDSN